MADPKKPGYQLAFDQRQQQLEDQIRSEHKGQKISEDPQVQVRSRGDSQQLGGEANS